jgi:hypothetical protein
MLEFIQNSRICGELFSRPEKDMNLLPPFFLLSIVFVNSHETTPSRTRAGVRTKNRKRRKKKKNSAQWSKLHYCIHVKLLPAGSGPFWHSIKKPSVYIISKLKARYKRGQEHQAPLKYKNAIQDKRYLKTERFKT